MVEQFPVPHFTAEQRQLAARPTQLPGPGKVPLGVSLRLEALRAELAGLGPEGRRSAAIKFWAEVTATGTPLVEEEQVTFLWRAKSSTAAVLLVANKRYDRFRPQRTALRQLLDTDIWYLTLTLPGDWVGSYQFLPLEDGDLPQSSALRPNFAAAQADPLGQATLQLPGETLRSVLNLSAHPTVTPRPFLGLEPVQQSAELSYQVSRVTEPQTGEAGPVVVVLDGELWLQGLVGPQLLEEAAHEGLLPALDALWVHPGRGSSRGAAYGCSPLFADAVVRVVDQEFGPQRPILIVGSSLSGLQALYCALRHPKRIVGALGQSPSLWWPGPSVAPQPWLLSALEEQLPGEIRPSFVIQYGSDEGYDAGCWHLLPGAASDTPEQLPWRVGNILRDAGSRVTVTEVSGGHDPAWWQIGLIPGLVNLLQTA